MADNVIEPNQDQRNQLDAFRGKLMAILMEEMKLSKDPKSTADEQLARAIFRNFLEKMLMYIEQMCSAGGIKACIDFAMRFWKKETGEYVSSYTTLDARIHEAIFSFSTSDGIDEVCRGSLNVLKNKMKKNDIPQTWINVDRSGYEGDRFYINARPQQILGFCQQK
jgi:hypothetical protein